MSKRYFNWKLAIVLVIGLAVFSVAAFGLRRWQKSSRAEQGLALGNKAYLEQRWEDAARNLGRYLAVNQNDVPILLKYADAQLNIRPLKSNNIKQAENAWRRVLRMDKSNSEAALKLAKIYLQMNAPGEAELIARRYLEREPPLQKDSKTETNTNQDPELRRILALALAEQRKFKEAATELKTICKEYPEQILAYETLGQLAEQRPDDFPGPAFYWYEQAVKNNPSSALAYIIRAGFHLRNNDRDKALYDLEQAEKQDLSDSVVHLRLVMELINTNDLDKAEKHLTLVQTAEPTNQALWQSWTHFALKAKSREKMLQIAETGLKELSSQPWDFMPTATELFIRCGQLDRAAECIAKLRNKDIAPAHVAFLEGLIANEKGQSYEAVKCWRQAIELGNKSPQTNLALASALFYLGDMQSAIRQLRTLVSERPNLLDGRLALARMLAQAGNWPEAAEQARIARQISPDNLGAALLYLQAQIQQLAEKSTDESAKASPDIEKQLSNLDRATNGTLEVKLLQLQLAIQQHNFTDAEALLNQLKKDHPLQIRIALAEIDLLVAQEKNDEAISMLNKAIEEFPQAVEPVRYLAILLAHQDESDMCEGIIKDALARIEDPITQRKLGFLLVDLYNSWGQEEKAYILLTSLTEKLPNDVPIKRQLLRCEQVVKNTKRAQQLVNDIRSLEGERGLQWRYEQARIWFGADNFKDLYPQIISLLRENMLTNPDEQANRILLAASYERAGELQLAISTYRDALSRTPDDVRIIIPTVAALYKAKEYEQADEILNRASRAKLYHPQLQKLQLHSYIRHGQLSSASDILQELINNDPNNQDAYFSLALLKMQQNELADAEKLLTKLKNQEPNSLPVTYAQIQLNIRQNKPEKALSLSNEIVNNLKNASAYILRARTYNTLEQIDKAIQDIEHATSIEPNNIDVWVARSQFYRSIGQPDMAIADIQQALSLASNNIQIQKHAISLLLASGNSKSIQQGRIILGKALESNPEDIDLLLLKAHSLLAEGTAPAIEDAERILQKITEDQPQLSDAWLLLAEITFRQGQSAKAIDIALRGLAHRPNNKSLLLLKAQAEAASSPVLAIPTLKALRELEPNDVDIVIHIANTYIAANEPQKAINILKTQLTSCSETTDKRRINTALAIALHKNGDKAAAQKEFEFLLQSDPDNTGCLLAQAKLLKDDHLWDQLNQKVTDWYQKHPKDSQTPITIARELTLIEDEQAKQTAQDILQTILENDPNCTKAMSTLAILLQIAGHFDESVTLYQKVLAIEPGNVIAINNLAWIMCEGQGKHKQALKLAEKGITLAPSYVDLIDTRGVAYYRLGEFNKAIQDFTTCIKLYPNTAPSSIASRFHLGRAYAELGKRDSAIEQLNQVLDLESQIGGLSKTDLAEVKHLIEELSQGG